MKTIRNLTASPYDLRSVGGPVRLPASGEVTAAFPPDYLAILERSPAVEVSDPRDPLDHDGDGKKGGSVDELDQKRVPALKAIAEAEGVDLGSATKKADIIAAIRLAREATFKPS